MEVLYGICGGVDVHKKLLVVCLRCGKKTEMRSFGTTTQELFDVAKWLKDNKCEIFKLMRIRLLKRYDPKKFTFEVLKDEYGIFAVRGPRGIPQKLSEALK